METALRRYIWAINVVVVALCVTMVAQALRVAVESRTAILRSLRDARAAPDPGIERCGERHYRITREAIAEALGNASHMSRSARIVPEVRDGQVVGLRLYSVLPGGRFDRIGLRNGDLVRTVNGLPLSSPEKALEVYAHLGSSRHVWLEVEREGRIVLFDYVIE
jgi:type II secretion system protein C